MDPKHTRHLAAGSIIAAASLAGLAAPVGAELIGDGPPLVCDKCEQPGGQETSFIKWDALSEAGVFYKVETVAFPKVEETAFPKLEQTAFPKVETHALFYKIARNR